MTRTVGIFGYLYPGKGHREVLDELSSCQPAVDVFAIGRASDRHRELVGELTDSRHRQGDVVSMHRLRARRRRDRCDCGHR